VIVAGFVLFAVAGLGFGFAAPGRAKLIPLLIPLVFAIGAFLIYGLEGAIILRLVIALVLTGGAILAGRLLEERFGGNAAAT
jgi:hypothetical protein